MFLHLRCQVTKKVQIPAQQMKTNTDIISDGNEKHGRVTQVSFKRPVLPGWRAATLPSTPHRQRPAEAAAETPGFTVPHHPRGARRRAGRSPGAAPRLRSLPRPDRRRAPPAATARDPAPLPPVWHRTRRCCGPELLQPLLPFFPLSPPIFGCNASQDLPPGTLPPPPGAAAGRAGGEVAGTYGGSAPGAGAAPLPASRHLGPPPRRLGARSGAARTALHSPEGRMAPSAP